MSFYTQYPIAGVPIYASFAVFPPAGSNGSLAVAADTDTLYISNGTTWLPIGSPSVALAVGALDAQPENAQGLSLVGGVLTQQSADTSHPGLVNNTTQSFSGNKTFTNAISASNLSGTNTGDLTLITPNGLSLTGQALSLALSSTSTVGALSAADWNTFNSKQTALGFTPENTANKGVANGYASLDANALVPITQIPPAALERLVIVANQAARFALTTATVTNGDTVKQVDTNVMYFVSDDTNLNNASGYTSYSAGTAASVAWSGITGVPIPVSSLLGTNTGDVTIGTANGLSLTGQALSLAAATTSVTGALTSTDFNTFNSKQAAGNYITALTGDATATGPGSAALTLATVNGNVGTFGSANQVSTITVNGKGLITAASNTAIQIAESQVTNLTADLAAKQSTTLTNAHILVGNVSDIATDVSVSGDLTIVNTGEFTIANLAVTNAKLAQMPTLTIKGNATGGTANAADLTLAQVNAILPVFTSTLNGLTPLSGGGSTNFLRADGTWAAPPGAASGTVTSVSVVSANGLAGTVATSTTTPAITLSTTITGILQGNGTAISSASTTGSGNIVLATSPALVTPNLGTPSALTGTNITGTAAGLTAGTVTTNANLTGVVTSVGNATAIANGAITQAMTGATATPTASTTTSWDASSNLSANNFLPGYTTTVTAAGTTTLTVASTHQQLFTGSTTQSVKMPDVSTLVLGTTYTIRNISSGTVSVLTSNSSSIRSMSVNTQLILTSVATSGASAGVWLWAYTSLNVGLPLVNPMTTGGDLIYGGTNGASTRLANGSAGNILTSGGGTSAPSWTTAVYPSGATVNTLLYASGSNTYSGLATANTSALVTNSTGVPSWVSGGTANRILRTDGTTVSFSQAALATDVSGTLPIANGGTGQTTKAAAFDALSPMTTVGDIIVGGTSGTGLRVGSGTTGQFLGGNTGAAPSYKSFTAPTVTTFTSGSGTYTTPAGVSYIRVVMVGGGGGGAGSGTASASSAGSNGNPSSFGSSLLVANGGAGAAFDAAGGAGGTASLGTGPIGIAVTGASGAGNASGSITITLSGGHGGQTTLGGGGAPGARGANAGGAAKTNTGSGGAGGGAGLTASIITGSGGGAGGYVDAIINAPAATYAYVVGSFGPGGSAGTSGAAGGNGADGIIYVYEYYQ